jgi:hypothetical protein
VSYYFLISSLPRVTLDSAPSMDIGSFRSLCSDHLSASDLQALAAVLDGDMEVAADAHPFVDQWRSRDTQLRNACARLRAARRHEDAGSSLRTHTGFDVGLEDGVDEAFNQRDPMRRERALDSIRWRVLDELSGPDPFASEVVFAYGLKLKLAERWAALDDEAGQARIAASLVPREEQANTDRTT